MSVPGRHTVLQSPRNPVLALVALLCAALSVVLAAGPARAEDASDQDSWARVAALVRADLEDAVGQHEAGNQAGAAAAVARALNTDYVASNLARAVADTLGAEVQTTLSEQFGALRRTAMNAELGAELSAGVEELATAVEGSAAQLDAIADLANPRDYAAALEAQTQAEREELDAQKQNTSQGRGDSTWSEIAAEMNAILDEALAAVDRGDGRGGSELVNKAYYQYYEKLGFERTVMTAISGSRVSEVENQFKTCRKAMVDDDPVDQITQQVEALQTMLAEDGAALDGGAADDISPLRSFVTSAFGQSFIILMREGLEAILVVAAIIAYLVKAGHRDKLRHIYLGALAGLAASGVMWFVFNVVMDAAGAHQETLEGVTALIAMVMLLFTSNWMLSKSSVAAWNTYIKDRTSQSLSAGSVRALAGLAFLAVFREGAETVMFYQALAGLGSGDSAGLWGGFLAAVALLLVVFLLIRFTSVKIPIGPFFTVTSALMALLVVVFAGGGVHAFIEGDVITGTYLGGLPTIDYLGIYPYRETVAAQVVALTVVLVLSAVSILHTRRTVRAAQAAGAADDPGPAGAPTSGDSPALPAGSAPAGRTE